MSGSIIENIILKGKIIIDENYIRYLIEDQIALGCFIAYMQTTEISLDLLWTLFMERSIDKATRGVILIKIFKATKTYAENLDENLKNFKNEGKKVINDFAKLSNELLTIKDHIPALLDLISDVYKDCFFAMVKKFAVNDSLCTIVKAGLSFQRIFNIETSLFNLSDSDLFIMENWKQKSVQEVLKVVEKGYKIVYANGINPSEPLSILVYVIFQTELKNFRLTKDDVLYIENIIETCMPNFSRNQKTRLESMYQEICRKFNIDLNYQIIQLFHEKQNYSVGSNERNIRFTRGAPRRGSWRSNIRRDQSYNYFSDYGDEYEYEWEYEYGYTRNDKKYYGDNLYEEYYSYKQKNFEIFEDVRRRVHYMMENLRYKARHNDFIDETEVVFQLQKMAEISPIALFYIFEHYSRNEKYHTRMSLSTWIVIKNALERCEFLDERQYKIVMDNICYLLENIKT